MTVTTFDSPNNYRPVVEVTNSQSKFQMVMEGKSLNPKWKQDVGGNINN